MKNKMKKEKKFEDLTEEQQKMLKKIVIARIKQMPDNLRLSIG